MVKDQVSFQSLLLKFPIHHRLTLLLKHVANLITKDEVSGAIGVKKDEGSPSHTYENKYEIV